jgi:aspartyl protease family protein
MAVLGRFFPLVNSDKRLRIMHRSVLALGALVVAAAPSLGAAQALTKCAAGQSVTDKEGKTGVIVSESGSLCQVKYADGQIYGWIFWNLRPAGDAATGPPGTAAPSSNAPQALTILKPPTSRTQIFRADPRGHFLVTAAANGAPLRFLVDTGASLVFLTPEDARAAGIGRGELVFSQRVQTANGAVRAAPVVLREIRVEQLSIDGVAAAVIENLDQSVLGMSFLKRLKSFEMREGELRINW